MQPPGGGKRSEIDTVEIRNHLLRDRRALELRNAGIIVEHSITGAVDKPVKFQIVDPFPSNFEVDGVGFHPNYEPTHGRIDGDHAVLSGTVEPGDTVTYRFGIRIASGSSYEEIEAAQQGSLPSIELSEAVGGGSETGSDLETAAIRRSTSAAASDTSGADGFLEMMGWTSAEGNEDDAGEDRSAAENRDDTATASVEDGPTEETDAELDTDASPFSWETIGSATDPQSSTDSSEPANEPHEAPDSSTDGEASADASDDSEALIRGQGDPFGETETDSSLAAAIARDVSREAQPPSDEDSSGTEPESPEGGDLDGEDDDTESHEAQARSDGNRDDSAAGERELDAVEALIRQLEAGAVSDVQASRLADQIEPLFDEFDAVSESFRLRLERLESRVQAFGTYADALEAIIDEHGPADEFLAQFRTDIRSMETEVERIEHELDDAAADRRESDDRLDSLADTARLLEARLERLSDRLASTRSSHRSKFSTLADEIEQLEPAAERVDELERRVDELSDEVEAAEARRQAIVEALSPDDSSG